MLQNSNHKRFVYIFNTHITDALKVINLKRNDRKAIDREIAILKSIHHPHILKYVEHFQSKEYMFLVTDIVLGGELFDAIIEREHYSEHDAREVVYTLLRTLEYLHFKNIVHCDVNNIYITFCITFYMKFYMKIQLFMLLLFRLDGTYK